MAEERAFQPVTRRHITAAGGGEEMLIAPAGRLGFTSGGGRFVVRMDPRAAMELAVAQLQAVGFALGDDAFQRLLTESGSQWQAQDLRLGDIKRSRRRGLIAWLVDDTGLEFFRQFWRGATPTLVVASARATPSGTELVIFPHVSTRGGPGGNDAAPLIRTTLAALNAHFTDTGTLVSFDRMRGIKNDGSPASQAVVRDLLGWR